jgi:hypothetical protein
MIITFFSPSTLGSASRLDTGVAGGEDVYMDDDDDLETENAKITSPGESITSARAFMR